MVARQLLGMDDCAATLHRQVKMTTPPLKLLLSDFAHRTWGPRIAAAVPTGGLSFVTSEEAVAGHRPCDVDFAFMTREVTGRSKTDS